MVQAGLVGKWHRDEVTSFKMKQSSGKGKGTNVGQGRVSVRALAIDHLQVLYYYVVAFSDTHVYFYLIFTNYITPILSILSLI